MNPKEKAKELFNKYEKKLMYDYKGYHYTYNAEHCKQCALIAVDEIIKSHEMSLFCEDIVLDYWEEVKQEIEKL